ncbi:MAG: phage major capsid protein [Burkholderiaceae bacterium]|jgi:hypothetical protein|nr:phage major capsid protein [Burkholderiaceae bacterium]
MSISSNDLAYLSKVSLDDYLRNKAIDNISVNTPLLKKLSAKKKTLVGGRQNVVVNIRKSHDSNFAWTYGEASVGFNRRYTTDQAAFPWRVAVDGFYIPHDYLFGNGVEVREGERGAFRLEKAEKNQLLDLMEEQTSAFTAGFLEKYSLELHRDGTAGADAITGLDGLITTAPGTGTVGGIDRSTSPYWRNSAFTDIAYWQEGFLAQAMEAAWRECIRAGGGSDSPDLILAGSAFVDAYRQYAITVTNNANAGSVKRLDAGVGTGVNTGLYFKGVEILWDPQFSVLDALDAPDIPWEQRCYFLNTKFIELRDDGLDVVTPTRPYNVRALYQMIKLRTALVMKRSNAHAVLSLGTLPEPSAPDI